MIRTQVQLTDSQYRALKRLAAEQNVSMAEIIRQSIDAYFSAHHGVHGEKRITRAKAAAGKFRSGSQDLSVRHDDYLGEIFK